jgi:hypothetical protein
MKPSSALSLILVSLLLVAPTQGGSGCGSCQSKPTRPYTDTAAAPDTIDQAQAPFDFEEFSLNVRLVLNDIADFKSRLNAIEKTEELEELPWPDSNQRPAD